MKERRESDRGRAERGRDASLLSPLPRLSLSLCLSLLCLPPQPPPLPQVLEPLTYRSIKRRNAPSAHHCGSSFVTGYLWVFPTRPWKDPLVRRQEGFCSCSLRERAGGRTGKRGRVEGGGLGASLRGPCLLFPRFSLSPPCGAGHALDVDPPVGQRAEEEDVSQPENGEPGSLVPCAWGLGTSRTTLPQPVSTARCFWSTG